MEWKSDFIESYEERGLERGLKQGLEQGLEQGLTQGLERGIVETKRTDVFKVLDIRRLRPTKEQRIRVEACTDLAQLDLWFERSLTALTAADVFRDR